MFFMQELVPLGDLTVIMMKFYTANQTKKKRKKRAKNPKTKEKARKEKMLFNA